MRSSLIVCLLLVAACGKSIEEQCEFICEEFVDCGAIEPLQAAACADECVSYADACEEKTHAFGDCIAEEDACGASNCADEGTRVAACWQGEAQ